MTYPPANVPPQPYGHEAAQYGTPAVAYGSWIQRVGAYLIDSLITAPFGILASVLGQDTDEVTGAITLNAFYWVFLALSLALWGYNRWFQAGKTGQSWGKKALGLRLVNANTGQPIGAGMAFLRDVAHIVDQITCLIGWLFPLWDAKRQTLADKIVSTVVVR